MLLVEMLESGEFAGQLSFLPLETIRETLFHELSHFYFGEHDDKFYECMHQM